MAERPTPHSLVLSTLIVLASLPTDALEDCYVVVPPNPDRYPERPVKIKKLGWASNDGRGYEDNDAANDDDDDDEDGSGENVQVSGRYPSLIAPPSGFSATSAANVRRSSDEREQLWESVREFLVEAISFGPSSASSHSSTSGAASEAAATDAPLLVQPSSCRTSLISLVDWFI